LDVSGSMRVTAGITCATLTTNAYDINYLVVGGGSGGNGGVNTVNYGPGGAGGCAREGRISFIPGQVYTIRLGAGGGGTNQYASFPGGASSIIGLNIFVYAPGGYAASGGRAYLEGASNADYTGGHPAGASSGGGAGAGGYGLSASGTSGGGGGNGYLSYITGTATYYGGGGAGSGQGGSISGGSGGGGQSSTGTDGVAGAPNTGGGGGGTGASATGGAGGSGVVILSIPTSKYSGTTTGSLTVTTSGSNTILKYTTNGTYTA